MSAAGSRDSKRGSTLIEMLAVVAIMGLIGGLAFPRLERLQAGLALRLAAANLAADLRVTRAQAIRSDAGASLVIAQDGRTYRWPGGQRTLPDQLRVSPADTGIAFTRRGSAGTARLTIAGPGLSTAIALDGASGAISQTGSE